VNARTFRILNTMGRPLPAVLHEMTRDTWMPITRRIDRHAVFEGVPEVPIQHRHHPVAARYRESSTRTEIPLDVNNQQSRAIACQLVRRHRHIQLTMIVDPVRIFGGTQRAPHRSRSQPWDSQPTFTS